MKVYCTGISLFQLVRKNVVFPLHQLVSDRGIFSNFMMHLWQATKARLKRYLVSKEMCIGLEWLKTPKVTVSRVMHVTEQNHLHLNQYP